MGEVPEWYLLLKAARYLGVPPWELVERPKAWMEMALEAEAAEVHTHNEKQKRAAKQRR